VYVKTHPETSSGRKGGHFAALADGERVVVLRQAIEPLSLLREMDHVYVVSSTLGFEALLAGKPVHCFGLPWYAGWGATTDALRCDRRTRSRNVDELFAAAYLRYTRYLNPETHERGTIFDVIAWLVRQRRMAGLLDVLELPHG
jgi:capsular polysaccharide export protein